MAASCIWKSDRSGAKLWRYRYGIAGKGNGFAAGVCGESRDGETNKQALGAAQCSAGNLRLAGVVMQGIHPAHNRQAARLGTHAENANTFEAVAREWMAKKMPGWTAYNNYRGFLNSLKNERVHGSGYATRDEAIADRAVLQSEPPPLHAWLKVADSVHA